MTVGHTGWRGGEGKRVERFRSLGFKCQLGLVSTSQTCSCPGTERDLTLYSGRVTPSRPAMKGRA